MKLGKYEFGLIKPFKWHGFGKSDTCGCTIYTLGIFYFTILLHIKCFLPILSASLD